MGDRSLDDILKDLDNNDTSDDLDIDLSSQMIQEQKDCNTSNDLDNNLNLQTINEQYELSSKNKKKKDN